MNPQGVKYFLMKLSELSLFALRFATSYIWISAGISKLFNKGFIDAFPKTIDGFMKSCHYDFYIGALKQYVLPNAHLFAQLTIWGEILTGIAFLLGFPLFIAALVGIFMNINYFLVANSTPSQFLNIIMIFSQFALYACTAGNIWGLSAKIGKK